jgi:hypothetical protein
MAENTLEDYRVALRSFIKDHDFLNRLLKFEQESTNDELDLYINMAIGFMNSIPPMVIQLNFANFPLPSLLIHQATIECLVSNGIVNARNDLTYNNGGVTAKIQDANRYLNLLQMMYRMTDAEIRNLTQMKIAANIMGGFGGVYSPYATLHGRQTTLNPNSILAG